MRVLMFSALLSALAGCSVDPAPLAEVALADAVSPESPPTPAARGERVELDRQGGAVLAGHLQPVLAHTDQERILTLDEVPPGALGEALRGREVLDARFVTHGAVILDVDHALVAFDEAGTPAVLDAEAHGPLSVASGVVAYTRGAPPDLELVRAYPARGLVEALTEAMAPVWSPALSEDGREVLFVSGAQGQPALHRLTVRGELVALPPTVRIPSAPTAPLWDGETLVFEDELGVVALDTLSGEVREALDGARGLARVDGRPMARLDGTLRPVGGLR